jgi:hypothetical protein
MDREPGLAALFDGHLLRPQVQVELDVRRHDGRGGDGLEQGEEGKHQWTNLATTSR